MTEDELFAEIELDRVRNNQLFVDWLRMSYRCPNCREAAKQYHRKIWEYDESIHRATAALVSEKTEVKSPPVPAAFISAIAEEGTKAEAVEWLQKTWNENCALRAALKQIADLLDGAEAFAVQIARSALDEKKK